MGALAPALRDGVRFNHAHAASEDSQPPIRFTTLPAPDISSLTPLHARLHRSLPILTTQNCTGTRLPAQEPTEKRRQGNGRRATTRRAAAEKHSDLPEASCARTTEASASSRGQFIRLVAAKDTDLTLVVEH